MYDNGSYMNSQPMYNYQGSNQYRSWTGAPNMPSNSYTPRTNYSTAYVNSEEEAYRYPVAPGNTIILMDLNNSRFYMKSADFSGQTNSMRVFEYTEVVPDTQHSSNSYDQYISRSEFEDFKKSFTGIPMKSAEANLKEYVSRDEFESLKRMVEELDR